MDFTGAKIALFVGCKLLVIQRDDFPSLRYAGMWDFPGGGREGDESPTQCAVREINEELGIIVLPEEFEWEKRYASVDFPGQDAVFLVLRMPADVETKIVFGDEGQGWKLLSVDDFLQEENAVPFLGPRLQDYLER